MKIGVVTLLRSVEEEIRVARACEEAGVWGLGLGDTAPHLYQDVYVTAAACLQATRSLHIGPTVTNTVSRHWSVLASAARTFDELVPGRFFVGLSTGDGAVHSVGLRPAPWARLEEDVHALRPIAPESLELHVAASGPRGASVAGRIASDLMIGTGLSVDAIRDLSERARQARETAGVRSALRVWTVVNMFPVRDEATADRLREELRPRVTGFARFAFESTFEGKAVPEQWHEVLRDRLADYDFRSHGNTGETSNSSLFGDLPELEEYLLDRFLVVGSSESCAERIRQVSEKAGLDGIWLAIGPSTAESDMAAVVTSLGLTVAAVSGPAERQGPADTA